MFVLFFLLVFVTLFQRGIPAVIQIDKSSEENKELVKATCSGKKTGLYAHPTSCFSYISCDERGTNEIRECKPHNHFHPEYRVCVWEEIYHCSGDTPVTGALQIVQFCQTKPFGTYPDTSRCNRYVICSKEGAYRMQCPNGLLFNSLTDKCDEAENVICDVDFPGKHKDVCEGKKPGNYRSLTNCNEYVACTGTNGVHMKCPKELWFDEENNKCDIPTNVKCPADQLKPTSFRTTSKPKMALDEFNLIIAINYSLADGSSAHLSCKGMPKGKYSVKGACQHYYSCSSDKENAKLLKCPKHKNFHPVYRSCVWTYLYSCDDPNFCKDKHDGTYRNINNCYGYYQCSGRLTFPRNCDPGLRFNGDHCVDASEYVCPKLPKIRVDVVKRK